MTTGAPNELEKIDNVARRRWALEQRLNRVSYREIAETLGASISTIRQWVKQETVNYLPQEEREELIAQELANIDRDERRAQSVIDMLGKKLSESAQFERLSDVQAATQELRYWQGVVVSLRKERNNIKGLAAPVRVQHNLTVRTEFDEEIELLAAELTGGGNLLSTPDQMLVDDDG